MSREHSKETGWRWETIGELVDEPDKRVINYEFGTPEMAKNCISGTISNFYWMIYSIVHEIVHCESLLLVREIFMCFIVVVIVHRNHGFSTQSWL